MIGHGQDLTFTVEMVDRRKLNVARSNTQSFILDGLKKLDDGRSGVRKPDWRGVFESLTNIRFVSLELPRDVAVSARIMFNLARPLAATAFICGGKVRRVSRITPRISGRRFNFNIVAPEGLSGLGKDTSGLVCTRREDGDV